MEGADAGLTGPVLLVGADGLVGRHVRSALAGRPVVATSHRGDTADTLALDLEDDATLRAIVRDTRPAAIILAAAQAHVERCEVEPELTRRVNVEATRIVADSARAHGAVLVVFSSEYVFDGTGGAYAEDDDVRPINEYGRQKVAVEQAATSAPHLVCRTSGVFGWEPRRKNFVCQAVHRLRAGEPFAVPSDQLITPTYAPDLAHAVVRLLDLRATGIVHVCGPRILGRLDFAREVARVFELPEALIDGRPTASLDLHAPRPLRAGLRSDRLRGLLGHPLRDPVDALSLMRRSEPDQRARASSHE